MKYFFMRWLGRACATAARSHFNVGRFAFSSVLAAFALIAGTVRALPADPDLTFGVQGRAILAAGTAVAANVPGVEIGHFGSTSYPTAMTRDGKVLIVGACPFRFCLMRLNADGTLDTTFRNGGLVATPQVIDVSDSSGVRSPRTPSAVVLQPDEKIIVAGSCDIGSGAFRLCASRFHSNGDDDLNFGVSGTLLHQGVPGQGKQYGFAAALQNDGKLLIGGSCEVDPGVANALCMVRYLPDGTADPSFGNLPTVGHVQTEFVPYGLATAVRALVISPNGAITAVGYCANVCMVRVTTLGALDPSLNPSGAPQVPAGIKKSAQTARAGKGMSAALLPDGSLLVASLCVNAQNIDVGCIGRYLPNGDPDSSFGYATGITDFRLDPTIDDRPVQAVVGGISMAVQHDGKAVIGGSCKYSDTITRPCVVRYRADGSLDLSFRRTVRLVTTPPVEEKDIARALVLQPDGKIVQAGYCGTAPIKQFCAFRYEGGPSDYAQCSADIDGDGALTLNDSILLSRIVLGFRGSAVLQDISFNSFSARTTWPAIRDYLFNQCAMAVSP
jgi:uncharacterized delta-60 repeat protein